MDMLRRIVLLLIPVSLASLTPAQDRPQKECSLPDLDADNQPLSVVKPESTTSWQCYSNGNCSSFQLHAGDSIEIARTENGWTCGYVTSTEGAGAEWVRNSDIAPVAADTAAPVSAWFGTWRGGEDTVHIQAGKQNGWLTVQGKAVWDGLNGNQHFGDIKGEVKPAGNKLHYSEGQGESECEVDLTLIGDYILARDNNKCGGMNARFAGVWRRKKS